MIPLVDLQSQYRSIKAEIAQALNEVLERCDFVNGRAVAEFEEAFAAYSGAKYAIGVANGTEALTVSLRVLGIGPGDRVVTVANTFTATAESIVLNGAVPVFVDVDPATALMSIPHLEQCLKQLKEEKTPAKAIIPVHLYGQACPMDAILSLAQKYGCHVLEDCAQAHGASFKQLGVGTVGIAGCFSFYPGKNLGAFGDAGAVITNDATLAQELRMYIDHGRKEKYLHESIGTNSRLDTIQAAVLNVKLKHLRRWTEHRRQVAAWYRSHLQQSDWAQALLAPHPDAYHVYHLFVLTTAHRTALMQSLREHKIACGVHYATPLHLQPAYQFLGYKTGDLPVTESLAGRILSLPCDSEISEEKVSYICQVLKEFSAQLGRKSPKAYEDSQAAK